MGQFDNYRVDVSKQNIVKIFLILAVVALILAYFAPNALGLSDVDISTLSNFKAASDACVRQLVSTQQATNQTYQICAESEARMNRLADGYKNFVIATFLLATAINLIGTYWLLRRFNKKGG